MPIKNITKTDCYRLIADSVFNWSLPFSNRNYRYTLIVDNNEVVNFCEIDEVNNEACQFESYTELREYYHALNKRAFLPEEIEDLFEDNQFELAHPYIADQEKIKNIDEYIAFYQNIVKDEILGRNVELSEDNIFDLESVFEPEINADIKKYEIPLLVYFGEYLREKHNGKWVVCSRRNILGKNYYYPDLVLYDEEINYIDKIWKVLYLQTPERYFNLRVLMQYQY
nr:hypothetical protein [uncultured Flavobacterium sp.]